MNIEINSVGSKMGDEIKAFRSAAVTSENKATPLARAILAALVAGLTTADGVVSTVIHAFGNPKSPKSGKPVAKLSGLRDFVGGDATRKTVETIMAVHVNIDFDKPRDAVGDMPAVAGAAAIRPLIVSFILADAKAPKSLKALLDGVKALIDAHVAATAPASDATDEEKGETEGEQQETAPLTLSDRIATLMVAIDNATGEEFLAADEAIAGLMDLIKAAYACALPENDEVQQLAAQDDDAIALSLAA